MFLRCVILKGFWLRQLNLSGHRLNIQMNSFNKLNVCDQLFGSLWEGGKQVAKREEERWENREVSRW
jgi:hypothetical protein